MEAQVNTQPRYYYSMFMHSNARKINKVEKKNSFEDSFLRNSIKIVEDNISNFTFDFDGFANELYVSKSTLYRRIKQITGLSPVQFIRTIRLKHSLQLLIEKKGNITEIAYAVGYDNPKYFSESFKKQFGKNPSYYLGLKGPQEN